MLISTQGDKHALSLEFATTQTESHLLPCRLFIGGSVSLVDQHLLTAFKNINQ